MYGKMINTQTSRVLNKSPNTKLINIDLFIQEIHKYPSIWYRNTKLSSLQRKQIWTQLEALFGVPDWDLKAKWSYLKRRYHMETKRLKTSSSNNSMTWPYYEKLHFLNEIETETEEENDKCSTSQTFETNENNLKTEKSKEVKNSNQNLSKSANQHVSQETDNIQSQATEEKSDDICCANEVGVKANLQSLESIDIMDFLKVKLNDDICLFFLSIVPHLKALPVDKQMLLKIKIQKLIYKEVYTNSSLH